MPHKNRQDARRFNIGDSVEVLPIITTRFIGQRGVITAFKENRYASTLDEYTVQLPEGFRRVFSDIQLKRVD